MNEKLSKIILANLIALDLAVIGFVFWVVKNNAEIPPALQPTALSGITARAPQEPLPPSSPLAGRSSAEIRFQEYYEEISDTHKKCVRETLGEERISLLLKENPFLQAIPLSDSEVQKLFACSN